MLIITCQKVILKINANGRLDKTKQASRIELQRAIKVFFYAGLLALRFYLIN